MNTRKNTCKAHCLLNSPSALSLYSLKSIEASIHSIERPTGMSTPDDIPQDEGTPFFSPLLHYNVSSTSSVLSMVSSPHVHNVASPDVFIVEKPYGNMAVIFSQESFTTSW
ncbi:hypothetical protein CDAR_496611 [Caerostris darwini]|uniref:Uncharacterized protein n=1 Tax=Caerostris darwini TaxID=1538125 RepID=A0AAV4QHX5_9ARAC|nr:hypothetical protein CDAR_496611 [Caerostris darwini]